MDEIHDHGGWTEKIKERTGWKKMVLSSQSTHVTSELAVYSL